LPIQTVEAFNEFFAGHTLGFEEKCIRRISMEPPIRDKEPAFL
jgi:hypothetical protein